MATKKYAPKLPLELDSNGNFIKIDNLLANAKQKLKMLILTNPGEKLMDPQFGVGIRKYLFEPTSGVTSYNISGGVLQSINTQNFQQKIESAINEQVFKYCNDITIYGVEASLEEQTLKLTIKYNYKNFLDDTLAIEITI